MNSEVLNLKLALQVVTSDLKDILGVLNKIEEEIAKEMNMKPVSECGNDRKKVSVSISDKKSKSKKEEQPYDIFKPREVEPWPIPNRKLKKEK